MNELEILKSEVQRLNNLVNALIGSDRYTLGKTLQIFDGRNVQVGITTGTKIGTATTQKIGFFNKTPVAQQAAISSPSADVASLKTAVDALITELQNLGLTA